MSKVSIDYVGIRCIEVYVDCSTCVFNYGVILSN